MINLDFLKPRILISAVLLAAAVVAGIDQAFRWQRSGPCLGFDGAPIGSTLPLWPSLVTRLCIAITIGLLLVLWGNRCVADNATFIRRMIFWIGQILMALVCFFYIASTGMTMGGYFC